MRIEIKRWNNGKIILCGEYESIKDSNRKLLENTRMEMSRSLRIAAERLNIN